MAISNPESSVTRDSVDSAACSGLAYHQGPAPLTEHDPLDQPGTGESVQPIFREQVGGIELWPVMRATPMRRVTWSRLAEAELLQPERAVDLTAQGAGRQVEHRHVDQETGRRIAITILDELDPARRHRAAPQPCSAFSASRRSGSVAMSNPMARALIWLRGNR